MIDRVAKYYVPFLVNRVLHSDILDKWFRIPCTNRAMDELDEAFGLDYYILKTHERDLNSKLAMDLKRHMLLRLCEDSDNVKLPEERQTVLMRYKKYIIPREEAEWVGLMIKEALQKAEETTDLPPLKHLIEEQYLKDLQAYYESDEAKQSGDAGEPIMPPPDTSTTTSKSWLSLRRGRGKSV